MLLCSDDVLIVAGLTERRNTLGESPPVSVEGGLWLWSASEEQLGTLYWPLTPWGHLIDISVSVDLVQNSPTPLYQMKQKQSV